MAAASHADFQQKMSNLPSTIRAEKLRSPTRKVRRGDLTWPENDLRHLPPSPKAVPLSSSLHESEKDQEIFSETIDRKDAGKATFNGTAGEWEQYLQSRKIDPEDSTEGLPDNIVDGNKIIQEKLKDIEALKNRPITTVVSNGVDIEANNNWAI